MHEFRTIPTVNVTYIRSQNYTSMVVGEHGIRTFEVCGCCVVAFVITVWCFRPHKCASLIILGQVISRNMLKCQFLPYMPSCFPTKLSYFQLACHLLSSYSLEHQKNYFHVTWIHSLLSINRSDPSTEYDPNNPTPSSLFNRTLWNQWSGEFHDTTKQVHDGLFPKKQVEINKNSDNLQSLVEKFTVLSLSAMGNPDIKSRLCPCGPQFHRTQPKSCVMLCHVMF